MKFFNALTDTAFAVTIVALILFSAWMLDKAGQAPINQVVNSIVLSR